MVASKQDKITDHSAVIKKFCKNKFLFGPKSKQGFVTAKTIKDVVAEMFDLMPLALMNGYEMQTPCAGTIIPFKKKYIRELPFAGEKKVNFKRLGYTYQIKWDFPKAKECGMIIDLRNLNKKKNKFLRENPNVEYIYRDDKQVSQYKTANI